MIKGHVGGRTTTIVGIGHTVATADRAPFGGANGADRFDTLARDVTTTGPVGAVVADQSAIALEAGDTAAHVADLAGITGARPAVGHVDPGPCGHTLVAVGFAITATHLGENCLAELGTLLAGSWDVRRTAAVTCPIAV